MFTASLRTGQHTCAVVPVRGQLRHRGGKHQFWNPMRVFVVLCVWAISTGISIFAEMVTPQTEVMRPVSDWAAPPIVFLTPPQPP